MRRRSALKVLPATAVACLIGGRDAAMRTPNRARVDETRLAHLTRGINTSHWFAQTEFSPAHFRTYITPDDVSRIEALGFRHVRLNVDPMVLFDTGHPERLSLLHLPHFDEALDMILASGLAIIVDLHPDDAFKTRLARDHVFAASVATFWGALARHIAARDPELVFLEVLNEPRVSMPTHWAGIQAQISKAIRDGAPRHTVIATGHQWSSVDDLVELEPLTDGNVVYNFHLYDPFTFTHQGAMWGDPAWPHIGGVPYPSSPDAVEPLLAKIADGRARDSVVAYGRESWDSAKLEARLLRAVGWATLHRVSLTCNEFGVYRRVAPPAGRIAWLRDVRSLLERFGIGWAMWDYAEGFGLMQGERGKRLVDFQVVSALGLS